MSTFHRDLMAAAHYNAAVLVNEVGKSVSIYDGAALVAGWSNLIAVVRQAAQKDIQRFQSVFAVDFDHVIEISRQGSFPGSTISFQDIRPDRYKIKYGSQTFEVNQILTDDSEIIDSNNKEAAAVIWFMCTVMKSGKGQLPLG